MRNYLKDIEIVGAVLVYQEGGQCRWSIDWLLANCDRVCIALDNYNEETKAIALDYKIKHGDRVEIMYTHEPVSLERNKKTGQIKKRFKLMQAEIREHVIKRLHRMHEVKPIDMIIWPDSDETFINCFPEYLTEFWKSDYEFMMVGFLETYDSLRLIMRSTMAPHGRVYKYKPEMTIHPWIGRTRYHPYTDEKRPWKVRHLVVHNCWLTEEYRERRRFFENSKEEDLFRKELWILPKDVREMRPEEIAKYQPGPHGIPSEIPSIKLKEYLANKEHYLKKYNIKLWN